MDERELRKFKQVHSFLDQIVNFIEKTEKFEELKEIRRIIDKVSDNLDSDHPDTETCYLLLKQAEKIRIEIKEKYGH